MSKIYVTSITMLITTFMLLSCGNEKQPRDLFEEQQSGVCMVLNSYYYRIDLPTGSTWYCTGIDSDGDLDNLTIDEDEAKKQKSMATGTAFFIDNEGTLLTNRHVVNPAIEEDVIKKAASRLISQIKDYLQYVQLEYVQQYDELNLKKQDCYKIDYWGYKPFDHQQYYQIEEAQKKLEADFYQTQEAIGTINGMDLSKISVTPVSQIGIAYNNTYVTGEDDFLSNNPCVVTKISNDEDVDLALIQLKNKNTPAGKYVFKIKGRDIIELPFFEKISRIFMSDKDESIAIGKDLVMIGYNAGVILGNTQQGIQAQMTTGNVSQKPDGTKILYSIPTLQGSSGSPVIDTEGYVRAVNYAKLRGTDSFNFGIPENQILRFLNQ